MSRVRFLPSWAVSLSLGVFLLSNMSFILLVSTSLLCFSVLWLALE